MSVLKKRYFLQKNYKLVRPSAKNRQKKTNQSPHFTFSTRKKHGVKSRKRQKSKNKTTSRAERVLAINSKSFLLQKKSNDLLGELAKKTKMLEKLSNRLRLISSLVKMCLLGY